MIKGVAFDLEGTLVDIEIAHHRAHLAIAKELGLQFTLKEARHEIPSFVGGPDIQILKEIAEKVGFSGPLHEILERDRKYYKEYLARVDIYPRPGVLGVLKYINKLGLPMAIGSGTRRIDGLKILKASSLRSYFETKRLIFAEDVVTAKPAPDTYKKTAESMGIPSSMQLVFEDAPQGVRSAVAASSVVIAIPTIASKSFTNLLLTSGAWRVIKDWKELNIPQLFSELNSL